MLSRWYSWDDFDRLFHVMDQFSRAARTTADEPGEGRGFSGFANAHLFDRGSQWVVKADLPGVEQKDLQITANSEGLTLTGSRKDRAPEGYAVHRRERDAYEFSRSFTFPSKVDPEKVTATLKDGVLTVSLEKAAEHQPRRIEVKAN